MPRKIVILLTALLVAILYDKPGRVAAQGSSCDFLAPIQWRETTTRAFSIQYAPQDEPFARQISAPGRAAVLDREAARFQALFETSQPLSIRIYPDIQTYTCLNSSAGTLLPGVIHIPTGTREISLISANLRDGYSAWAQHDLQFIRSDLGIILARQIAGENAPSGLLAALGRYLQDPRDTIGALQLNLTDWLEPGLGWRALWLDGSDPDLGRQLSAASTIAYLVDTYGWDTFLVFLSSLSAAQSFAPALEQAYGLAFAELEDGWRQYYPSYFQGRWRSHLIFNHDLARFEALIREEKYAEADQRLQAAASFLEKMHQPAQQTRANQLLGMARSGQQAEAQIGRSRQAFQAGDYQGALDLLQQAELSYAQTGNRLTHLDELAAYRQQVVQVLELHARLETLRGQLNTRWDTFLLSGQLISLGRRLSTLGDVQGHRRALEVAQGLEERQMDQYSIFTALVAGLALLLLAQRVRLARRSVPPEAQL